VRGECRRLGGGGGGCGRSFEGVRGREVLKRETQENEGVLVRGFMAARVSGKRKGSGAGFMCHCKCRSSSAGKTQLVKKGVFAWKVKRGKEVSLQKGEINR